MRLDEDVSKNETIVVFREPFKNATADFGVLTSDLAEGYSTWLAEKQAAYALDGISAVGQSLKDQMALQAEESRLRDEEENPRQRWARAKVAFADSLGRYGGADDIIYMTGFGGK